MSCCEVGLARAGGALTRENVGISNYYAGENPARRISKVYWATLISPGLAGPKCGAQWCRAMDETVDIASLTRNLFRIDASW